MNSLFAMRVLLFAGECFLASSLAINLAWLAAAFSKRASLRHLIWTTAFGALLLFPLAALLIPSHVRLEHAVAAPAAAPSPPAAVAAPMPETLPGSDFDAMPRVTLAAPPAATPAVRPAKSFAWPKWHDPAVAGAVLALWLAGLVINALRGVLAIFGLRALLRRSVPHDFAAPSLPELARTRCRLRLFTGNGPGPVTWGFVKPVILLPHNAVDWAEDRLKAVLRHELAHVRRQDCLVQALSLLVSALYWPNPLVWLGARALRREAEIAADDAVLASGVTPSVYAGELVRLAAEFHQQRAAFSGIAMAGQSALEDRVRSVLAPSLLRSGVSVRDGVKIACLALAATGSLALLRPDLAVAQNSAAPAITAAPLPPVQGMNGPAKPVQPVPVRQAQAAAPPAPAAPAAPPVPPTPPSILDDAGNGPDAQEQETARQEQREAERAAAEARREADMAKREAAHEAAQAKREAEQDAAEAKREAAQDAAEAKRDAEQEAQDVMEEKREAQQAAAEARREVAEQMVQVRAAGHDAEQALAEAHIGQTLARAMAEAEPQIDAAVAEAMRSVQPQIGRAMAGVQPQVQKAIIRARISEVVARALAKAQPQIDAAIAKVRREQFQLGQPADPKSAVERVDP